MIHLDIDTHLMTTSHTRRLVIVSRINTFPNGSIRILRNTFIKQTTLACLVEHFLCRIKIAINNNIAVKFSQDGIFKGCTALLLKSVESAKQVPLTKMLQTETKGLGFFKLLKGRGIETY